MRHTIESLEQIESSKSIQNFSPLKPPAHQKNLGEIMEEEEKNEFTSSVGQKLKPIGQKPKPTVFAPEKEKMEENADCLALQLFQMKNEEQFEYDEPKNQKK